MIDDDETRVSMIPGRQMKICGTGKSLHWDVLIWRPNDGGGGHHVAWDESHDGRSSKTCH